MDKVVSCCGVVCSECEYYSGDCRGCPEIEGKVFWLAYTGGERCAIYDCCVGEKKLPHCGACPELPCARYDLEDPTKSHEENAAALQGQLQQLRGLPDGEEISAV